MHLAEDRTVRLGAATVGVACTYEGRPGFYVLAMPMEGEFVVIGGRGLKAPLRVGTDVQHLDSMTALAAFARGFRVAAREG